MGGSTCFLLHACMRLYMIGFLILQYLWFYKSSRCHDEGQHGSISWRVDWIQISASANSIRKIRGGTKY